MEILKKLFKYLGIFRFSKVETEEEMELIIKSIIYLIGISLPIIVILIIL